MTDPIVSFAPAKIVQIMEAGRKQLSPEDFAKLRELFYQLQVGGLTTYLNTELGKLLAKIQWELEISESPEWAEALIACDAAFLGSELKEMCEEYGLSPHGHKKELCRKLYHRGVPEVVEVMEPYLQEQGVRS